MLGIYFSGTGNSKHALEIFLQHFDISAKMVSIEDESIFEEIEGQEEIVFSYPVQYSSLPKILHDFVAEHRELWADKQVFVIATMGLFSGDGAGMLARLLKKYGARITGGLHLKMPDSIADEKALKRSLEENKRLVAAAEDKIKQAAVRIKEGNPPREGLGVLYHLMGLFGQRLYFGHKTKHYTDKLKIDQKQCVGCGKCAELCPMGNIVVDNGTAEAGGMCTMCYRCVNTCPRQAITLLGRNVVEQGTIEKYLKE